MNAGNPHDLHSIRPNAELDRPHTAPPRSQRSQRRRKRPQREGWSLWSKVAAVLVSLVVLLGVGVAGIIYFASPAELVRNELIRQVKSNTGRELSIKGPARFVFYPSIGVSLGNVELSGPPGMAGGPMVTAERIDVSVRLMPLLSRKVQIEHVGLVRPMVDLHVDQAGRQSWDFAALAGRKVRVAQLGAGFGALNDARPNAGYLQRAAFLAAAPSFLDDLELRSVSLTKAIIVYRDDRSQTAHRVDDLDLQLDGRRLADPLKAYGGFVWQNERLKFSSKLDTVAQIIAGRAARAHVTISGRTLSAGFDGTVKLGSSLEVEGQTRLGGDSLASTARWLGMEFPNAAPLGGFQASGRLVASPQSVALNGASLGLGDTKATGVVRVALRSKRPYISADLKMTEVDIDRLSAGFAGGKAARATRSVAGPRKLRPTGQSVRRTPAAKPKSIEDLLRRSENEQPARGAGRFAPQVRGYTNRNEWSTDPIDSSALGLIDAKARLRIDGLKVAGVAINRTVLRLALADSSARIDVDDIQLYGGAGKGVITARPRGKGIGFGANLSIDKVAARPLLKDAAGFERLDGRGQLTVIASGAGVSQKAIANSINGTATFNFKDGAIVGWNLAKIMRGAQRGQFSNIDATQSEKTDFSELAASFKITNGVAVTNDLRMISPLIRLTGQGNVGVGARNLDMTLRPKLVASLHGQGAQAGGTGLEIPVKLKGPWHDPSIAPDFAGISKDPSQLLKQAKKLGKQFKGKNSATSFEAHSAKVTRVAA